MNDTARAPVLRVDNLVKTFAGMRAVDGISFEVNAGEILVILGGSGCGKTTTLRCIAGLEEPTEGEISLDGALVASKDYSLAPERREIGMVFQSYALWPHKTVGQNVSYGLEGRRLPRAEIDAKVATILDQVGLGNFRDRYPSSLSGGQQQRVALARSAVLRPKLLLLDEPLSNLDAKLREQMRDDLRGMIRMFGMSAVHITHDQAEAMSIADRILCMRAGRIEQAGTPREIYRQPATRYVADFIGASALIEASFISSDAEGAHVKTAGGLELTAKPSAGLAAGAACLAVIRPEAVSFVAAGTRSANTFAATVKRATFLGSVTEYALEVAGIELKAASALDLEEGAACHIAIDARRTPLVPL